MGSGFVHACKRLLTGVGSLSRGLGVQWGVSWFSSYHVVPVN